ncbi:hypothetical protein BT67DRAFT_265626 [Trichocladium antarcticum]|uniref:Uncharacterized protein n=1 Tax=Trichocladium antarcticum TaxID=1450529 RepID=A0AAN6UQA9_9PEZI|nr:hypothetical protein BT67DRAFT_265626 [Trichocladium antarcticum]
MNDSSYAPDAAVDTRGYVSGSSQAGYPAGGYPPYGGGQQSGYGGQYAGYDSHQSGYGGYQGGEHTEKRGNSGLMMGAAGGLAVGALAGAVIAHELNEDDSGSEHGTRRAEDAAGPVPSETNPYEDNDYGAPPPGVLPTHNYEGEEIDSSDRESLREARDDYEEALEAAASSSASSSEREELEEARQEYEEEYEEAYYDD